MAELPTPAVVPAGHVVRIRAGGIFFTSRVMSPSEAQALADKVADNVDHSGGLHGFVIFEGGDGVRSRIKARAVTSIDVGPPRPRREEAATTVVHNHFADGGAISVAELVELSAETEQTAGCSCGARGDLDFILEHPCPLGDGS